MSIQLTSNPCESEQEARTVSELEQLDQDYPEAVMLCNTSLHLLNAIEACEQFHLDPRRVWVVITLPPLTDPDHVRPILGQKIWGKVIWIKSRPAMSVGWRFLHALWQQYRFHRGWQRQLSHAKHVRKVFSPLNRLGMNRLVVNWLAPRQVVWYDDGTLSYVLARELTVSRRKSKRKSRK